MRLAAILLPTLICLIGAPLLSGCNPPLPTLKPDMPAWLQPDTTKAFTARLKNVDQWDVVRLSVTFNPGSFPSDYRNARSGAPVVRPGGLLEFDIPSGQDDFLTGQTVFFQWTATVRMHGQTDLYDLQTDIMHFTVACIPGRTNPAAGVANPGRLTIVNPCASFDGTAKQVIQENEPVFGDGDTHINIWPDPGFQGMLNAGNYEPPPGPGGQMVAEIVPADKPGCTPPGSVPTMIPPSNPLPASAFGTCTTASIGDPMVNSHIRVIGPLVEDTEHGGYREIHPVWRIIALP